MKGYILATTPIFSRLLNALAGLPKSPKGCIEVCPFGALDIAEIIAGRIIRGAASLILPPGKTR